MFFQLALRTVNSSRSAYACFIFVPTFFTKYDGPSSTQKSADDSDVLKCKITMKVELIPNFEFYSTSSEAQYLVFLLYWLIIVITFEDSYTSHDLGL